MNLMIQQQIVLGIYCYFIMSIEQHEDEHQKFVLMAEWILKEDLLKLAYITL